MLELTQAQVEHYLTSVSQRSIRLSKNLTLRIEIDYSEKNALAYDVHDAHQSHIVS